MVGLDLQERVGVLKDAVGLQERNTVVPWAVDLAGVSKDSGAGVGDGRQSAMVLIWGRY